MSFLFLKKFQLLLNLTTQFDCIEECRFVRRFKFDLIMLKGSVVGVIYQMKKILI